MDEHSAKLAVSVTVLAAGAAACYWGAYLGWRQLLQGTSFLADRVGGLFFLLIGSVLGAGFVWLISQLLTFTPE